jgi:SAM-dependent methyltransferase
VQAQEFEAPENIFSDYAYFSSYSESWVNHARSYTEMIIKRLSLTRENRVMEIASNDGYLLQFFLEHQIPVLGIEPAANIAEVAEKKGIQTVVGFFGTTLAQNLVDQGNNADLVIGNNVLAHVPRLNDFVEGLKIVLKPGGVITMEFPHLMRLVEENQFDTIYHEHFSYLSFATVENIFNAHGLRLFDVEELPTHGGSLRIYACHADCKLFASSSRMEMLKEKEIAAGYDSIERYSAFSERVKNIKRDLVAFLIEAKRQNKSIAGYGAPGKGNTLLNYCGIRADFLDYTVDRNPYKHGKYLPGTGIPIFPVGRIAETRPDYLLILPWNLKEEVIQQMEFIRNWGGKFILPIPELTIL